VVWPAAGPQHGGARQEHGAERDGREPQGRLLVAVFAGVARLVERRCHGVEIRLVRRCTVRWTGCLVEAWQNVGRLARSGGRVAASGGGGAVAGGLIGGSLFNGAGVFTVGVLGATGSRRCASGFLLEATADLRRGVRVAAAGAVGVAGAATARSALACAGLTVRASTGGGVAGRRVAGRRISGSGISGSGEGGVVRLAGSVVGAVEAVVGRRRITRRPGRGIGGRRGRRTLGRRRFAGIGIRRLARRRGALVGRGHPVGRGS